MLGKYKTSGMLYFLYNKDVVAVLVCHDIKRGEFVLQVPFFPPIESIEDYKRDKAKCMEIVKKAIFAKTSDVGSDIEIKNVNSWVMEAIVAQSYINKYGDPYAFLVGDAAHAFPPSGGFGMNTGIGDSFNLAHKIA
jgi:2-polyprenyl-6-methoxyphenol hydroxylase-like FAD-dependent oxidoreductase